MQTLLQSLLLLFAGISIATASVWVNEVADKGDYTVCGGAGVVAGRDWVELYNDATSAADISGWKIHDDHGPDYTQAYIFPVGTILPPKSYTILCQADSFIFGIGGADNVTLRNSNGEAVSTSGVLLSLGSATNTYQLKDDHVTYAYAFPTPGKANVFPGSPTFSPTAVKNVTPTTKPTSRPVAKITVAPSMKKIQSTTPSKPTAKVTSEPVAKVTSKPTVRPSSKTAPSPSTAASVFVNEVADKGDYTVCGGAAGVQGRDWVELSNDATSDADISGWKLHDDRGPNNTEAYIFPVGTILPPKSYTILCQADSFMFGINGVDNVTLRNRNGDVVSTSGVLLSFGSATNTYQLKDDHVTYAYAYPTPGKANVFPISLSSSPAFRATASPVAVKVTSSSPVTKVAPTTSKPVPRPSFSPDYNPKCKDSAWATFTGPTGATKRCSDLSSKFLPQHRRDVCNSSKSNAATVCPDTCNGYCVNLTCSDSPKAKFKTDTGKHHYSCSKLSKLPVQDRRFICAFNAAASATCPSTCSGKC